MSVDFTLKVTDMQNLGPQALAGAVSIGASFGNDSPGAIVLNKARDWYIEHRDVIRGAINPSLVIDEAAELETNCRSRYEDVDSRGRKLYVSGIRTRNKDGETVIITLEGALPFESYFLWEAFAELELWHWDGISEGKRVYGQWFSLTEKVAQWACGEAARAVITWLFNHDSGIDDRPGEDDNDLTL